jgi:hypothetical protein
MAEAVDCPVVCILWWRHPLVLSAPGYLKISLSPYPSPVIQILFPLIPQFHTEYNHNYVWSLS